MADLLDQGIEVRGVDIRSPRGGELPDDPGFTFLEADLTRDGAAAQAVEGMDCVIHTAALVDIALDYETLRPLNVDAVRGLYLAAARAGVRRFVHFSSGSVYGDNGGGEVVEDDPLVASSDYERSKIESEKVLEELHHDVGLDWIVVRPSLIYGPGARFLVAGVAAIPPALQFVFGNNVPGLRGGPTTNLVHAEDVARAAVFLMRTAAPGRAYNVADPTPLDVGTIFTSTIRAYGLEPSFTIPLPEPGTLRPFRPILDSDIFFRAANAPMEPLWRELVEEHGLKDHLNPSIDRESAPYMFRNTVFSVDRLRVRGFTWKHPDMRKSIGSVMRWYEDARWIPRITEVRPGGGRTPRLGFAFTETMSGRVKLVDDAILPPSEAGRPFVFTVTARATRVERFLRDWEARIEGILYWDGMADGAQVRGVLHMPLFTRRQLHYDFSFTGDDGREYRFKGRKDVDLRHPVETMTTLPGRVLDADEREVARGEARFDLRKDLLPMVSSFSLL
ncbi:MAG: NAD(P)-dependent oxidoreductase [Deltaproteobacteria bacterium]|nr:NAD(P)-dependent oxidoreductase [Deltaproteobacteria bacterium]